ncbi:hypothetical protein ACH4SP_11880 [Streptomyces sp. NPDC021093]|uniref:hypothetical protein n=1 Tax=Streptomyces sp. NPDC021093 TaxID=3365112 RepID=UPI00379C88B4
MDEEVADQQAEITRLLIYYTQTPFVGSSCVRGILPVPGPGESTRIVTGNESAHVPDGLTVYEIPLRVDEDFLHVYEIAAILRAVHTGPYTAPSVRARTVLGMPLVQIDTSVVETAGESPESRAFIILRTLVHPFTETKPVPRLLGFLCREPDLLRLYVDTKNIPGVLAVDVRPSGALTALLAALPSLIGEEGRVAAEEADPHASYRVDLTYW